MTTPTQIAEFRKDFESISTPLLSILLYQRNPDDKYRNFSVETEWQGYLRARTEQADEIAALKAKLAGVMPLAKFAALTIDSRLLMRHDYGTIDRAIEAGLLSDEGTDGLVLRAIVYKPNIEATIERILKD